MRSIEPRRLLQAGCALALALAAALALAGCAGLATRPADPSVALAGEWQLDAARSDDFDARLTQLLKTQRERMRARHGSEMPAGRSRRGGGAGSDDASAATGIEGLGVPLVPLEDPGKERARLAGELQPPARLRFGLVGEAVEIAAGADPPRRYLPGQSVSRIDSSGAASVESGWSGNAFVVNARYTDRSSRSWRYELDANGLLRRSFSASDPDFGQFALETRYQRALTGTAPPAAPAAQ